MAFPERFSNLPEYAFPRLRALLAAHAPGGPVIDMTIGEPKHAMPEFVGPILAAHLDGFGRYPPNDGTPGLLAAISDWIARRYGANVEADRLLALNGTREGLLNAVLALCPETRDGRPPVVLMPDPFYQAYAIGALCLGAEPVLVPATAATGFLPDYAALSPEVLNRTAIAFLCSPANPQGVVAPAAYLRDLLSLAERHGFQVFGDECYSEIWRDTPPPGLLQIAAEMGADPERVVVFHSLSKRSNLPGLRSGFVAAGPESTRRMRQLRTYAGAPLPLPLQHVAEACWRDEAHVTASRALYQQKFRDADAVFAGLQGYRAPEGGFFLWLPVADGEQAALTLWRETGVRVLPGAYLSRGTGGDNPGANYIRVALVAVREETERGLTALRDTLYR